LLKFVCAMFILVSTSRTFLSGKIPFTLGSKS
jgi:hypothetical protein